MVLISVLFALFVGQVHAIIIPDFPLLPYHTIGGPPSFGLSRGHCTTEDFISKDLDLILYGATGFTGGLAAQYLSRHPQHPRWAIGGRSKSKLDYIYSLLKNSSDSTQSFVDEILVFDLLNAYDLLQVVKRAKAVLSFAGPYEKNNGEALILAALEGCTHYVDITTETVWKSGILRKYGSIAAARGVAVVQSAGLASALSDFLAMSAIEDMAKIKEKLPDKVMVLWTKLNDGRPSQGQVRTFASQNELHYPNNDPYILVPHIKNEERIDFRPDGMEYHDYVVKLGKLGPSSFAETDCPVIRRSIRTKFPKAKISVQEAMNNSVFTEQKKFFEMTELMIHQNPELYKSSPCLYPFQPCNGPPPWVLQNGTFASMATCGQARVTVEGRGDPFFMGSARMATELAVGLALRGPYGNRGGYLTPSLALGIHTFEERLERVDGGEFMKITHEWISSQQGSSTLPPS